MVAGTDGASAVRVADAHRPAVLTIGMPSSYVYLGGTLAYTPVLGAGGACTVAFSANNGLDWSELPASAASGAAGEQTIDLSALVRRRYDYQLRFTLSGAGSGLDRLMIGNDIQHSQRALPALGKGANTIRVRTGPQEGTITVEAAATLANRGKQLVFTDFHPTLVGMKDDALRLGAGQGSITFPVHVPGDLVRLRFGCNYRARDARDGFDLQASLDGGATFTTVARAGGPTGIGFSKYVVLDKIPAGTREVLVRYAGQQVNTTMISGFRIDADYHPAAAGFLPMRITYKWTEEGKERIDEHVTARDEESYVISCAAKPSMESITMEVANAP